MKTQWTEIKHDKFDAISCEEGYIVYKHDNKIIVYCSNPDGNYKDCIKHLVEGEIKGDTYKHSKHNLYRYAIMLSDKYSPVKKFNSDIFKISKGLSGTVTYRNLKEKEFDFDVFLPKYNTNLQREYVWELYQKRALIESIIKEIYIPTVSILSHDSGTSHKYEVIDGKQRILTYLAFVDNQFSILDTEQNHLYFNDLDLILQHKIKTYCFLADVIYTPYYTNPVDSIDFDDDMKIAWFKNINFAGTQQDIDHLNKFKLC